MGCGGGDSDLLHPPEGRAGLKPRCEAFVPRPLPVGLWGCLRALPFSFRLHGTHNLRMLSFLAITQKGINSEFCVEDLGGRARFN